MKIVFFTRCFHPHLGGVEKHLLNLSRTLVKQHDVTVVTEKHSDDLPENEVIDNGIKVLRMSTNGIQGKNKKFVIWRWISRHSDLLNRADILHAHDVYYWIIPYKLTHPGKSTYVTFHGWEGVYPVPSKNILIRKICELLATKNICVGDYIPRWYGTSPDMTIYGAVSESQKTSTKSNSLLFLGRLDKDTGFDQYLELQKVKAFHEYKFVVAGDGPLRSRSTYTVDYKGFIHNTQGLVAKSSLVFATGYMSILEAFIAKKLVLSTYSNPLKGDYLLSHPMAKNIVIGRSSGEVSGVYQRLTKHTINSMIEENYSWAKTQTWEKLANDYKTIWK